MSYGISLECEKCKVPLPRQTFNTGDWEKCPSCETPVRVYVFPSLFAQPEQGLPGEGLVLDSEAACYFHPKKKAVMHCALCGRFLCTLCDVEFKGQHVCPSCLEAGKKKSKIKDLETHRVLYDDIALAIAIIPLLFVFVTILTAPISIYTAVRYWNAPTGIVPRTKFRFIAAITLSVLQIAGWVLIFYFKVIR